MTQRFCKTYRAFQRYDDPVKAKAIWNDYFLKLKEGPQEMQKASAKIVSEECKTVTGLEAKLERLFQRGVIPRIKTSIKTISGYRELGLSRVDVDSDGSWSNSVRNYEQ